VLKVIAELPQDFDFRKLFIELRSEGAYAALTVLKFAVWEDCLISCGVRNLECRLHHSSYFVLANQIDGAEHIFYKFRLDIDEQIVIWRPINPLYRPSNASTKSAKDAFIAVCFSAYGVVQKPQANV
jgi:hypothetical protein